MSYFLCQLLSVSHLFLLYQPSLLENFHLGCMCVAVSINYYAAWNFPLLYILSSLFILFCVTICCPLYSFCFTFYPRIPLLLVHQSPLKIWQYCWLEDRLFLVVKFPEKHWMHPPLQKSSTRNNVEIRNKTYVQLNLSFEIWFMNISYLDGWSSTRTSSEHKPPCAFYQVWTGLLKDKYLEKIK